MQLPWSSILSLLTYLYWGSAVFDAAAIIVMVFYERRDPSAIAPWLLVMILAPYVGFALYLAFGFAYFKQRKFSDKALQDQSAFRALRAADTPEAAAAGPTAPNDADAGRFVELARLLYREHGALPATGNAVRVFTEGDPYFAELLAAIRSAERFVHLEFYLVRDDPLGRSILAALTERAAAGVEVRFLYDDMGNKIPRRAYRPLEEAGGTASSFYRPPVPGIGLRFNYRNHRKLAVIDGRVGFVGGFNLGEEYRGKGPLGHWRDTAIRLEGNAVRSLQHRFAADWKYATKENLPLNDRYAPRVGRAGDATVQVVSSGPDSIWNPSKEQYLKMIDIARERLWIQTPYFIPDASLRDALRIAALSGVDVRVMIPQVPDAPLVHWANLSYLGDLLPAGVRGFLYRDGFLHAKTLTVDDAIVSIGTANFDIRSFEWNFEVNALIFDTAIARGYRRTFELDQRQSRELTRPQYAARGSATKFRESICRLASGLL
jgi:cardiolipin synthase